MSDSIDVKVRDSGYQGYIATGGGQRASCTHSAELALDKLAGKLFAGEGFVDYTPLPAQEGDDAHRIVQRVRITAYPPVYATDRKGGAA